MSEDNQFGIKIEDDFDKFLTSLEVKSNNGMDKGLTLNNARKKRMNKPILIEIGGFESSYKATNFPISIDEAKEISAELNRMVEYLEQIL